MTKANRTISIEIARTSVPLSNLPERWCTIFIPAGETQFAGTRALWVFWKGKKRWVLVQKTGEAFKDCAFPRVTLSQPDQRVLGIKFNPKESTETKAKRIGKNAALALELWLIHSQVMSFACLFLLVLLSAALVWHNYDWPSARLSSFLELCSPLCGLFAGLMLMWSWQERIKLEERYHPIPTGKTGGGDGILRPTPHFRLWMRKQKVAIGLGFGFLLLTFLSALFAPLLRHYGL